MPVSISLPSYSNNNSNLLSYASQITKVQDYLYEITYNSLDWEYGKQYLKERYTDNSGGCSSIRNGNFFGRNYDWSYDECAYFVIRINKSATTKYSSIGMTGGSFSELTKDFVESGEYTDLYKVLPFITVDGINECGVVVSSNVVPTGDKGITTGTIPTETKEDTMCIKMLIRYILDNFATASEAVDYIKKHISIYAPNKTDGVKQELHLMVADETKTYLLEFIQNELVVTDMSLTYGGRTYMTNFYLDNTSVDSQNHINFNSVTDYGAGLERYNIISDNFDTVNTVQGMTLLLQKLFYTNTYLQSTNPVWLTEFVDKEYGLKVSSPPQDFDYIISLARQEYERRTRNGLLWQTCHSVVYDIEKRKMYLTVQEDKSIQRIFTYIPWEKDIQSLSSVSHNHYLLANNWQDNTYTISDIQINPDSIVILDPAHYISVEQYTALAKAGIIAYTQDNLIILKSIMSAPTVDIPITITILGGV